MLVWDKKLPTSDKYIVQDICLMDQAIKSVYKKLRVLKRLKHLIR